MHAQYKLYTIAKYKYIAVKSTSMREEHPCDAYGDCGAHAQDRLLGLVI